MNQKNLKSRVLFATQLPPPIHGVSLIASYLQSSEALANRFRVSFVNISFTHSIKDISNFGIKKVGRFFTTGLRFVIEVIWKRPDLVYYTIAPSGPALIRDVIYIFFFRLLRIRYVLHIHGQGFANLRQKSILYFSVKMAFSKARVICLGHALTKDVQLIYPGKPFILNNGIKDHFVSRTRGPKLELLYLSNFIKSKGIWDALHAALILHKEGLDFRLRLVGSEYDVTKATIMEFAQTHSLVSKIEVVGPAFNDHKYEILSSSDILLLPTQNDAFPLVILEAMQFGVVAISTNQGSISEIVEEGKSGFLVNERNPNEIAEKVITLIRNPTRLQQMSAYSRIRYTEKFSYKIFEKNLLEILESCLGIVTNNNE